MGEAPTRGAGDLPADDAFVERYTGLVRSIAGKVRVELGMRPEELDDLVAWGMQGLLEARARFDASRGVQFQTFAYYRIRGAILDGIRKMTHLPRRVVARARAMGGADLVGEDVGQRIEGARLAGQRGPDPVSTLDDAIQRITTAFLTAYQESATPEGPSPEEGAEQAQLIQKMRQAIQSLPEREATLLHAIYFEDRTLDDIGGQLGVSRSWACRMHARALDRLRQAMGVG